MLGHKKIKFVATWKPQISEDNGFNSQIQNSRGGRGGTYVDRLMDYEKRLE